MSALRGTDSEKLAELATKTYKEQATWFLNSFWEAFASEIAEKVWGYVHTFIELDTDKKAEGCALDELQAHRFLEKYNETLTVHAMREKLRSTGAIGSQVRLVPLTHVLIFKFNADWRVLVNTPQGNQEELRHAEGLLAEVQSLFAEAERRAQEAAARLREAKAREADAKRTEQQARDKEAEARAQEAPFKAAQEEVDSALSEVKAQEDARNNRTQELKTLSTQGGVVQQNKAKNELAQHLAEDPLPLRKAKITLEAALKRAEKARAPFEAATKLAEEARAVAERAAWEAEAAAKKSAQANAVAEAALDEAKNKLEEAEAYLEEVKARIPHGAGWWLERELHEARAYLPTSKGGYTKKK